MTFKQYLAENAGAIEGFFDEFFAGETNSEIRKYLYDPLWKYTSNAGKRHRPLICLLACKAVGGDPAKAISSAAAIEHFHTAALIHDDIADESVLRRGKPCLHIQEGIGLAINAGDLALSSVMASVVRDSSLEDSIKLRIVGELVDMDEVTIEGQALDIGWARDHRYDITVDDYILMANCKTAFYSGAVPLAVGAIVGGGTEDQISGLRQFGMLTGLAFQIQDDLLNLFGDKELLGKDFRSDIVEGKRTYSVAHALSNSPMRDELIAILDAKTTEESDLNRAVEIMIESGSIDAAKDQAKKLIDEAKALLAGIDLVDEPKEILLSMADFFVERVE